MFKYFNLLFPVYFKTLVCIMMNRKDNQGKIISQIGCGFNCNLINNGLFDYKGKKKNKNLATKEGKICSN